VRRKASAGTDGLEERGARNTRMRATGHELSRRRRDARTDTAVEVTFEVLLRGGGAAVRLEAVEVEREPLGALPQVRVVEVALILEQLVVHLPDAAL
jgi:hypothetical protein